MLPCEGIWPWYWLLRSKCTICPVLAPTQIFQHGMHNIVSQIRSPYNDSWLGCESSWVYITVMAPPSACHLEILSNPHMVKVIHLQWIQLFHLPHNLNIEKNTIKWFDMNDNAILYTLQFSQDQGIAETLLSSIHLNWIQYSLFHKNI